MSKDKRNLNKESNKQVDSKANTLVSVDEPARMQVKSWWYVVALGLLVVVSLLSFSSAFDNKVTNWDDQSYIENNPMLRTLDAHTVREIFYSKDPERRYFMGNYHPLAMLSLALDFQVAGADSNGNVIPWPFIWHSVLLHIGTSLLVFGLVLLLWKRFNVALIAALLFAIHPIHVESVVWLSERKDTLYTFYFFATLLAYVYYAKFQKYWALGLSFLLFVLSVLSKGQAVSLAPTLVLLDYLLKRRVFSGKVLLEKLPFFLLAFAFGIIAIKAQAAGDAIHRISEYPFHVRIMFAGIGFTEYLVKLIAPYNLAALYPYPILTANVPILTMYVHLVTSLAILAGMVYVFIKFPKFGFGFGFYVINILLLLQLIPVGSTIMSDRYAYVPSFGIFVILALLISDWADKDKFRAQMLYLGTAGYLVLLGVLTFRQANTWQDSKSLWAQAIKVSPTAIVAWNNLGSIKVLEAKPDETVLHPEYLQDAIQDFSKALEIKPDYATALYNRGSANFDLGNFDEALKDINAAITADPLFGEPYLMRGMLRDRNNQLQEAIADFDKALSLDPNNEKIYVNRGVSKGKAGALDAAIADFDKALDIKPKSKTAYSNRGLAYFHAKKYEYSLADYNKAIALDNRFETAYANRGLVFDALGKWAEAVKDYSQALLINPKLADCYYYRATCNVKLNKLNLVCQDLQQAKALGMTGLDNDIKTFCE
ncbi:MAG: hypothetical protein RIS47_467 [Bacteroidota bacterium]|jgi:tetratricopeptide (TPR) repeat protein